MERLTRREMLESSSGFVAALGLTGAAALTVPTRTRAANAVAAPTPAPTSPVVHVVQRLSFGIRPGDLAEATEKGIERWVDEQLHPDGIDDSLVEEALAAWLPTLSMSTAELFGLPGSQVASELKASMVFRALFSRRQLYEVLVDFWTNHFNVYHGDGLAAILKTADDRDVIRAHALGNFRDLLGASARSPAMLYYLDNYLSIKRAPNENYGRELLELHTMGVDGGYTQEDVQEVARCFTGWGIAGRLSGAPGEFVFRGLLQDRGSKSVLGNAIPAGQGIEDGEQVLDLLALHPATARHLASKLCIRFVSDNPPTELVDRVAEAYLYYQGEIRPTLRTLFASPEFLDSAQQKFKRGFEFLISSLRTLDADISEPESAVRSLGAALYLLGQLPFDWAPPNGYPDVAGPWSGTNAMLNRWNISFALGSGWAPGLSIDYAGLRGNAQTANQIADRLSERILQGRLSPEERAPIVAYVAAGRPPDVVLPAWQIQVKFPGAIGLTLAAPTFQWR